MVNKRNVTVISHEGTQLKPSKYGLGIASGEELEILQKYLVDSINVCHGQNHRKKKYLFR